jgi:hypothetical protein
MDNMAVDLAHDLWQELKRYISVPDRSDAADIVVNLLIDNDHSAEEIRDSFKGDGDIKRALQSYIDDDHVSQGGEEEDYNDYVDDDEY